MDVQMFYIAIVILIGIVMIITCGLSIVVGFVLAKVRHPPTSRPLSAEEQKIQQEKIAEAQRAKQAFEKSWSNMQTYDGSDQTKKGDV